MKKKRKLKYKNIFKLLIFIVLIIFIIKKCTVKKEIDNIPPVITLEESDIILMQGDKYEEPGYQVIDNKDGDISNKAEVISNLKEEPGIYTIEYKAIDSQGNESSKVRQVTILKSPLDMSIKEFTLEGYYDDIILKQTDEQLDEYLSDFVFVGDSIPNYYGSYLAIKGSQLWCKNGINPETAKTTPININYGYDGEMLMIDAFKKYQPKYALITLGTNSAAWMQPSYFISEYKELLESIQNISPNTIIVVQSIPPVDKKLDENNDLNNKKINDLNYYILKMCSEMNIKFLNSEETMKDEDGTCKKEYCQSDGIHHTNVGINELVMYLKSHSI